MPGSVQICILGVGGGSGGGGFGPDQLNPKCQDLSKSALGVVQTNSKIKYQDLSKSAFWGGVYLVQINSTQSSKICPNLHWFGGPDQLNLKCQDLSKSAFWGWGGGVGVVDLVQTNSTQSAKICPNLHWGWSRPTQNKVPRSVQICLLGGGGGFGPDQLKPKVPRSVQICILGAGWEWGWWIWS